MQWRKKGVIYCPNGEAEWMQHSFLNPVPILMGEKIRLFGGIRDKDGISRIGFIEVSAENPNNVLYVHKEPVLDIGESGMFDDNGVAPTYILKKGNEWYIYYAGYCLLNKVRFSVFTGLAISKDNGLTFVRYQDFPITDRRSNESLFRVIHTIHYDENKYKVWYGAGNCFIEGKYKTLPVYDIRYMESKDGINFPDYGTIVIQIPNGYHRVGRPWVYKENGIYNMLYGYGSEEYPYKLAYAISQDGIHWDNQPINIDISAHDNSFDGQMMAYPSFIRINGRGFLFYNGNGMGKTGVGYAELLEN
ncbi:MAG: hypothetical protein LBF43_02055 [Puniceicoccales bacterium]|jgi:hypothetical protein|nr:hypothetical protein [Puniceicoccales bacterium]